MNTSAESIAPRRKNARTLLDAGTHRLKAQFSKEEKLWIERTSRELNVSESVVIRKLVKKAMSDVAVL
jgi:hypothetical protein